MFLKACSNFRRLTHSGDSRQAQRLCTFKFPSRIAAAYDVASFGMKILLLLLAPLAGATTLLAQTPAPVIPPDLPKTTSVLDAMMHAGPVMIPLFLLSVFSVMLVIVYFLTIRRGAVVSSGYMATADALLRKRDYLGLLAVSNRHGEAIARVVQKTLDFTTKNPSADFQQIREIAETEGTRRSQPQQSSDLSGGYRHDRSVAWFARHRLRDHSIVRCAGRGFGDGALRATFARDQRSAHQYGGWSLHRHSGDDLLRLLSWSCSEINFRTRSRLHARPRFAFFAVKQANGAHAGAYGR